MSDQIQPWPVVKQGSQGHPVPALQYLLRDRGHHVTVDGIFGPKTEAAVEQFQIADQLHVDGIVGPQTWRAWSAACSRSDPRGRAHPGSLGRGGAERAGRGEDGCARRERLSRVRTATPEGEDGGAGAGNRARSV